MSEFGSASLPQTPGVRSDRRGEERKSVTITAAVLSHRRKEFTTATIVDRSETGAKIKIDRNVSLPKMNLLVDFKNGPVFECEVRWRRDCYLGVRIIDVYGPVHRRRFFETNQLRNRSDFADTSPGGMMHDETTPPRSTASQSLEMHRHERSRCSTARIAGRYERSCTMTGCDITAPSPAAPSWAG